VTTTRYNVGTLGTSSRTVVQAGDLERISIEQIWICNADSSNRTVTLAHIPSGDDSAESNFVLLDAMTIKAGQTQVIDARIYLEPGDRLVSSASAAGQLVVTMYGRKR